MPKRYIYEDGDLVDVEDYGCEGTREEFCDNCHRYTIQILDCISEKEGEIWVCTECKNRL